MVDVVRPSYTVDTERLENPRPIFSNIWSERVLKSAEKSPNHTGFSRKPHHGGKISYEKERENKRNQVLLRRYRNVSAYFVFPYFYFFFSLFSLFLSFYQLK